jgi:lipid II:glycine glycyltransferase (peptidoglycan interpeptide bridge formation enzyme)
MSLYKCSVDNIAKEEWHRIVQNFRDGIIDQTWSYATASWGKGELSHLIVNKGDTVVAAAQVVLLQLPLIRRGTAFVKFGPMWEPRDQAAEPEYLARVLHFLRREYVDRRKLLLRIMPRVSPDNPDVMRRQMESEGFRHERIQHPERYLVNISLPLDLIRGGFKRKWNYNLRKSEQLGFEVVQGNSDEIVGTFLSLYNNMLTRKSFSDSHTIRRLESITHDLPLPLRPRIWLCLYDHQAVSGGVISHIGDTAVNLFGASNERGLKLRAAYFLQWSLIKWLKEQDCKCYDLGGDCGNAGLHQFKSGLAGKDGVVPSLPGLFDLCENVPSEYISKATFGLRGVYSSAQERLGKMLSHKS